MAKQQHPMVALRPAGRMDSDLLIEWRNDDDAVRFSGTARPVSAEEHQRWLAARLEDPHTRLWIAEESGTPVGQVRIDLLDGVGTVSIAVAVTSRGRGLGRAMLGAMLNEVGDDSAVRRLRALARPDNVASLRAFESAGFHRTTAAELGFVVLEWP